jgi:hypothetical protein
VILAQIKLFFRNAEIFTPKKKKSFKEKKRKKSVKGIEEYFKFLFWNIIFQKWNIHN